MLNENIKKLRKSKGLSQEELAIKLNMVRQTILKWGNSLLVPDSSMLVVLADGLDTPVDVLLGEPMTESVPGDMRTISEKLEVINSQSVQRNTDKVKAVRWIFISLCTLIIIVSLVFITMQSSYLEWNYNNPRLVVVGTILHGCEFVFVRSAPIAFTVCTIGTVITCKKR